MPRLERGKQLSKESLIQAICHLGVKVGVDLNSMTEEELQALLESLQKVEQGQVGQS